MTPQDAIILAQGIVVSAALGAFVLGFVISYFKE